VIEGHKLFPRGPHVWPALLYDILGRLELCREELKTNHRNSVGIVGLAYGQSWNTRRSEYVAHCIGMWQHANYIIICSVLQFLTFASVLFPHIIFPNAPPFLPSLYAPTATVHCPLYHVLDSVRITKLSSRGILRTSTRS